MNIDLLENEIFKIHPTYTSYQISNMGRVIGARGGLVTPSVQKCGYLVVGVGVRLMTPRGMRRKDAVHSVHRLVVETFIGSIPPGYNVDHVNGIKSDNRLSNLEVVTIAENQRRAYALGLKVGAKGSTNPMSTLTEDDIAKMYDLMLLGKSNLEIGSQFNVHDRYVSLVRHGKRWKHLYAEHSISKVPAHEKMSNSSGRLTSTPSALLILDDIVAGLSNEVVAIKHNLKKSMVAGIRARRTWRTAWERYDKLKLATTIEMEL